jgi:hypothetical protein
MYSPFAAELEMDLIAAGLVVASRRRYRTRGHVGRGNISRYRRCVKMIVVTEISESRV